MRLWEPRIWTMRRARGAADTADRAGNSNFQWANAILSHVVQGGQPWVKKFFCESREVYVYVWKYIKSTFCILIYIYIIQILNACISFLLTKKLNYHCTTENYYYVVKLKLFHQYYILYISNNEFSIEHCGGCLTM